MFINSALDKLFSVIAAIIIELFSDLNFDVLASHFAVLSSYYLDIVAYIYYFLPVIYLLPIFVVVFVLISIRISIAVCRLVFEFLAAFKFW